MFFPFTLICLGSQVMGEVANYLCSLLCHAVSIRLYSVNGRTVVVPSRDAIRED